MGIAVLSGILATLQKGQDSKDSSSPIFTKFIAAVRSDKSADRIRKSLDKYGQDLEIIQGDNVKAIEKADVVLLGCKPFVVQEVLQAAGVRKALSGKLLLTMLAGITAARIDELLYGKEIEVPKGEDRARVVRVMPSTAGTVQESMTTIESPIEPLPKNVVTLLEWMFNCCGEVIHEPAEKMDICTSLGGSGPAFCALILEGLADGAVAMGLPRADAQRMAAQVMKGTAEMVLQGQHPSILKENVSTPGGCTIGGLLVLEEGAVRGQMAKAVREATVVASLLGSGQKGVNGTRH